MENKFEYAIRTKMRFPYKGVITVEDLYDLSVENLDSIYKTLTAQYKQSQEDSLLLKKSKKDEELQIQIDIVKYIVQTKQAEEAARIQARENREKKQRLMSIIEAKKEADLQNKSVEELNAMLDALEG